MKCDCSYRRDGGEKCPTCTGEAVFVCERPGTETPLRLCSRCDLSGDKHVGRLYEEKDIPRLAALDAGTVLDADENPFGAIVKMAGGIAPILRDSLSLPLEKGEAARLWRKLAKLVARLLRGVGGR